MYENYEELHREIRCYLEFIDETRRESCGGFSFKYLGFLIKLQMEYERGQWQRS